MAVRTDLAMEAESLWRENAGETTVLPGVRARQWQEQEIEFYQVEILDERGEKALGKPKGTYLTLTAKELDRHWEQCSPALGKAIVELLHLQPGERALVVGLGNRAVTPDGIGPMTAERIFVTGHLPGQLPALFSEIRRVYALTPGVLGSTGLESADIVQAVVRREKPDKVIVVDALAAASRERLCRAVQVTDAGIVPGSGVGNARAAFSKESLGVPVCALGVPTVLDAGEGEPLMVTPRDIDERVRRFSGLLAAAINRALFPDWSDEEIAQLQN